MYHLQRPGPFTGAFCGYDHRSGSPFGYDKTVVGKNDILGTDIFSVDCPNCLDIAIDHCVSRRVLSCADERYSVEWILDALVKHQHDAETRGAVVLHRHDDVAVSHDGRGDLTPLADPDHVIRHPCLVCRELTPYSVQTNGGTARWTLCTVHGGLDRALAELKRYFVVRRKTHET